MATFDEHTPKTQLRGRTSRLGKNAEKGVWKLKVREKEGIAVIDVPDVYYTKDGRNWCMEEVLGEDRTELFDSEKFSCLAEDSNLIIEVVAGTHQFLRRPTFIERKREDILQTYLTMLRIIRFIFRIKNKGFEAHYSRIMVKRYKRLIDAYKQEMKKDGIRLLRFASQHLIIDLSSNKKAFQKYFDDGGMSIGNTAESMIVPRNKVESYGSIEEGMDAYYCSKMLGLLKDMDFRQLKRMLKTFQLVVNVFEGYATIVTASSRKNDVLARLKKVGEGYGLELRT